MKQLESAGGALAVYSDPKHRDWLGLRAEYEASGKHITLRYLAERDNIPLQTVFKRSMREKWQKQQRIVAAAFRNVEATVNAKANSIVEDQLAPWIEKQKANFIRSSFNTAKRGVGRVSQFQKANKTVDARNEANIAKALESFTRVGRTALGLSDGTAPTGVLNFQMLSNKTAVQIVQSGSAESP